MTGRRIAVDASWSRPGVAIGCVETAEHAAVAALAPVERRGDTVVGGDTVVEERHVRRDIPLAKDAPL